METLNENMALSEYFKHFERADPETLYFDIVGGDTDALWLYCLDPCNVNGTQVSKGDLLLYEKTSARLKGIFKPIANTSKQTKPTSTR